jgi:hypothetical protein
MNGRLLRSIGGHDSREQFRLDFLAAAPYMRDIVPLDYALVSRFTVIAFAGAKMLRLVCRWLWSLNDNVIQYCFQLSYIMPISPGDDDRQRDATLFYQHMAFASFFSPCPSGSDQPPPEPKVLWSWHYQYSAITRICPPCHHIPPTRLATWPEIPRPFPTGESRHGRNWGYRIPLWGEPSIGSRCGEHTQYLQIPCDSPTAFCRRPFSGDKICLGPWSVAVREVPPASKKHRKQPMMAILACAPPISCFMGMHAILFDKCQVNYG